MVFYLIDINNNNNIIIIIIKEYTKKKNHLSIKLYISHIPNIYPLI